MAVCVQLDTYNTLAVMFLRRSIRINLPECQAPDSGGRRNAFTTFYGRRGATINTHLTQCREQTHPSLATRTDTFQWDRTVSGWATELSIVL